MSKVPEIIQQVAFADFVWDLDKLHSTDIPVEDMPVSELAWHLEYPFWWSKIGYPQTGRYDIYPRDVIALHGQLKPEVITDEYAQKLWNEYEQTMAVDYENYPLDVIWYKGHWLFLDGLHRLCHAIIDGKTTVKIRKVTGEYATQILSDGKTLPEDLEI